MFGKTTTFFNKNKTATKWHQAAFLAAVMFSALCQHTIIDIFAQINLKHCRAATEKEEKIIKMTITPAIGESGMWKEAQSTASIRHVKSFVFFGTGKVEKMSERKYCTVCTVRLILAVCEPLKLHQQQQNSFGAHFSQILQYWPY